MITRFKTKNLRLRKISSYEAVKQFGIKLFLAGSAVALAACSGENSDEIAQEQALDLSLQQCEVARGGIVGTPTDPIVVDGVETQACLLNADAGQIEDVLLKNSHRYESLVWVLDGIYDIGQSKSYGTLSELQEDSLFNLESKQPLYAREGTVVVVHRNARLHANIVSVDGDNTGGGEWGGVVVNGIGYHPDCGSNASAKNFCNVEGEWGYFGGLSEAETRKNDTVLIGNSDLQPNATKTGFNGWVAEAGGETQNNMTLNAAITINAPKFGQTTSPNGSLYSAKSGLEVNGGAMSIISFYAVGNQGQAIRWHNGFAGEIESSVIYHDTETAALKGEHSSGSDGENPGVAINKLTLVDKFLSAGTALELSGGGTIAIDNVIVQGFASCLNVGDSRTDVAVSNSVFYCGDTTAPAADGVDYAQQTIEQATNFYTLNPDLTSELELDNEAIVGVAGGGLANFPKHLSAHYELGLYYEACYGVGNLLQETIDIGTGTYGICELKGKVTADLLYFDDDINGELVAWRINGAVTLGSDFAALDAAQQKAALAEPHKVIMDGTSRLLLSAGSALTLNPDVAFSALGTAEDPVELEPQDISENWAGMTINGLADSCVNTEVCQLAQQRYVDINYLRLLKAGNGRPALVLNEVNAAGQINYLDVADSAGDGLVLSGGAANIDRLLVANATGDQVQWSDGYRGTVQYAILQSGQQGLGHALHGRNNSGDHDADPRSRPVMASITMKGAENADTGILLEQGSGLLLYNSVVADFKTCLDIDDQSTADLQYTDPKQIYFDNVVLDCGAGESTLPEEDEDGGLDFANATRSLSGVYEVAAVLDSNFVATGPDIPAIELEIDFSLAGNSASYLDSVLNYMGSVRDSVDDWYLGWSDSAGVLLATECDFKGVLEDDYVYQNLSAGSIHVPEIGQTLYSYRTVCGLRGTITDDFVLTAYTGEDAVAVANGQLVTEELYPGYTLEREPAPTLWLINGLVRVGEGHLEITDPAQVEAMKTDPVSLGIEASAEVMVSAGGGLHITRGGELLVLGGEDLAGDTDTDASSPVKLTGLRVGEVAAGNWVGLIVDGFARNNQCPDALSEPGSRVCNIQGEYGYYGGYDDSHNNLWVENLHMLKGSLRLNSVGRGGRLENFYFGLGTNDLGVDAWGANNFGRAAIDIDGGAVNLRNINIAKIGAGSAIRWNHGYRGNLQSVYIQGQGMNGTDTSSDPEFFDTLYQDEGGNWKYYPVVRGANGEAGHENDLPRSMPTLANFTVRAVEGFDLQSIFDPANAADVRGTAIDLSNGSGVYVYNSVFGSAKDDLGDGLFLPNLAADQCISFDSSVTALLGEEVILKQVAFGCREMSLDLSLAMTVNETFESKTFVNNASTVANSSTLSVPSLADADIYYFDWVVRSVRDDFNSVPGIKAFSGWSYFYPVADVVNLGNVPMDYSASQSVDKDFIVDTNYFGSWGYMLPLEAGREIGN